MFGYVRPFKPELKMRQWTHYRSVYCGLCKQIGMDYGQLPRLSVTYDLTFLALLLLTLSENENQTSQAGCVLNPVTKKTIMNSNPVLRFCAGASVLLTWYKSQDDRLDGRMLRGRVISRGLKAAADKARRFYPQLDRGIGLSLKQLYKIEQGPADLQAVICFGELLRAVFEEAIRNPARTDPVGKNIRSDSLPVTPAQQEAIALLGFDLGRWIYLIDAIDDLETDKDNGNWNPLLAIPAERRLQETANQLKEIENALDRTAALLAYRRDADLIANIIQLGLPTVREQIFCGQKLKRL